MHKEVNKTRLEGSGVAVEIQTKEQEKSQESDTSRSRVSQVAPHEAGTQ